MAEAAKHAGVQHVIWSTLEDTRKWVPLSDDRMPTLKSRYKVPHFDGKGEADHFFRELGFAAVSMEQVVQPTPQLPHHPLLFVSQGDDGIDF